MSPTIRNGRGVRETFDLSLRASPPSPVERRVLTAAELAARGVPERPSPLAPVRVPLVTLADPPVIAPSPEEGPPMLEPNQPDVLTFAERLEDIEATAIAARRAWTTFLGARDALHEAEREWINADGELRLAWAKSGLQGTEPPIPSADMVLGILGETSSDPPANIPETIPDGAERRHVELLARREALRDAFGDAVASVALDNDPEYGTHSIGDGHDHGELSNSASSDEAEPVDDAPEVVTSAPIRGGRATLESGLTRRQEQVLEVVSRLGGDRSAAARELGIVYQSIDATLESIAKRGKLPLDLLAKLPARFAQVPPR